MQNYNSRSVTTLLLNKECIKIKNVLPWQPEFVEEKVECVFTLFSTDPNKPIHRHEDAVPVCLVWSDESHPTVVYNNLCSQH